MRLFVQDCNPHPNLTPTFRKKIWQNSFDMFQEDRKNIDVDEMEPHVDDSADQEMNGREIRNALMTARQSALLSKVTLSRGIVSSI
jgi:hypothetical protein